MFGRGGVARWVRSWKHRTMTDTASAADAAAARRDALVERLFLATVGTWDVLAVYVGDRLGLYRILAERGSSTSAELAAAAGLSERYVSGWLEQQASSAILEVDDAHADIGARRYTLPPGHEEALVDDTSLNCIAPIGQLVVACAKPMDAVLDAFRTGDGVPYADYGTDLHEGQARFTRPMFDELLAGEWLPGCPEVHGRLLADPPARVADVACGEGRSTIAIARGYPKVRVDGIDMDAASIEAARRHLAGSEVQDRVAFSPARRRRRGAGRQVRPRLHPRGAARHLLSGPGPCGVPRAADRRRVGDRGRRARARRVRSSGRRDRALLLRLQRFHCLPVGMVGEDAAGTGTVMRADTVRAYGEQAGFSGFEVLPIDNDFFRFYRLTP